MAESVYDITAGSHRGRGASERGMLTSAHSFNVSYLGVRRLQDGYAMSGFFGIAVTHNCNIMQMKGRVLLHSYDITRGRWPYVSMAAVRCWGGGVKEEETKC